MVTNTSLYVTDRNLRLFQDELNELRRQTKELLHQVRAINAKGERQNVLTPERLLQQERLAGRIMELDWLLKHVRPVLSPHNRMSVINQR